MRKNLNKNEVKKKDQVARISISLSPTLLDQFDKSMNNAGFSDRSKAIQKALYEFINNNEWEQKEVQEGAGALVVLYDNHLFGNDRESIKSQHEYNDIIVTTTHLHLDHDNCLETIILRGKIRRMKSFMKVISENRGIKSIKMHYVGIK